MGPDQQKKSKIQIGKIFKKIVQSVTHVVAAISCWGLKGTQGAPGSDGPSSQSSNTAYPRANLFLKLLRGKIVPFYFLTPSNIFIWSIWWKIVSMVFKSKSRVNKFSENPQEKGRSGLKQRKGYWCPEAWQEAPTKEKPKEKKHFIADTFIW